MTNPYETTFNPRTTNGSAFEMFMNPSVFGGSQNPYQQTSQFQQPQYQQPSQFPQQSQFGGQQWQQPWQQQSWQQPWQQQSWGQPQHQFGGNLQHNFGLGSQLSPFQGFQSQGIQQPHVQTTKAVEVELTIPAQRVIGRHPQEIQQYVLHVVLPVLLDGLVRRAINNDVGQSISSDYRECVARIGL